MKNFNSRISLDLEKINNHDFILGIDEVGWGPVAGPVCLGFCVIDKKSLKEIKKWAEKESLYMWVKDSKKLSEKKRSAIEGLIKDHEKVIAWAEFGSVKTVNSLGLAKAYEEALEEGFKTLIPQNTKVIIDGTRKPHKEIDNMEMIKKGDDLSWCIAMASIFAKNKRDRYIEKIHEKFPSYNWIKNKGYATKEHIEAIKKYGLTEHHRVDACKNFK